MAQVKRSASIINDDWRRWIGENLALDASPQDVFNVLVGQGVGADEATREVQAALANPYLLGARQAGQRLKNRLKKHDWVLDIYRTLNRQTIGSELIERRHRLSREEFYSQYYLLNKPVIISGMLDDWPALAKWNFDFLRTHFGEREVEVQMGRAQDANYEINSNQHKRKMPLASYLDLIQGAQESNDFYMTANNSSANRQALTELWQDIGRLPEYLNPESKDDGFLWLGPKGTDRKSVV